MLLARWEELEQTLWECKVLSKNPYQEIIRICQVPGKRAIHAQDCRLEHSRFITTCSKYYIWNPLSTHALHLRPNFSKMLKCLVSCGSTKSEQKLWFVHNRGDFHLPPARYHLKINYLELKHVFWVLLEQEQQSQMKSQVYYVSHCIHTNCQEKTGPALSHSLSK